MVASNALSREIKYFENHKAEYLTAFPGLFVLVKDEQMLGPFPTAESAYERGLQDFGLNPFLVKQVLEDEFVGYIPIMISTKSTDARL